MARHGTRLPAAHAPKRGRVRRCAVMVAGAGLAPLKRDRTRGLTVSDLFRSGSRRNEAFWFDMSDIMTAAGPTSRRAKAGLIAFGRAKFICKVRSLSASGAVLEIASSLKIPDLRFIDNEC